MFPGVISIFTFICLAIAMSVIGFILPKTLGTVTEISLAIVIVIYLLTIYSFTNAMLLMSIAAMVYGSLGMILNKNKHQKKHVLKQKLANSDYEVVRQEANSKRIHTDIVLTVVVSAGSVIFLLFAPAMYSLLKLFLGFTLISICIELITRIANYSTTKIYWLQEEEKLVIISLFESRELPLQDVKGVQIESAPDLLKLHPLFTILSSNQDYTRSFKSVLKLSFPGENIYITPEGITKWKEVFMSYVKNKQTPEAEKILPFWHRKNLQRLFWKGYFAVTVKGVSAYTGLLFILIWLNVPTYVMISFVLFWWILNLYVSDRVLIASTDAVELTNGDIFNRAQAIFQQASIPKTKLYLIDSPIYNGLATGMNIGRGTIMLTTATTQLSMTAIEAILAHEAIHIKKRDILITQLARMLFFIAIGILVYVFYEQIVLLAENLFLFILLFNLMMVLFPMYLSFVAQWLEVRADHLGAKLLTGGTLQMAKGLKELGVAEDRVLDKTVEYSMEDTERMKTTSNIERGNWFFRFIEFQFQLHPPLYLRIQQLSLQLNWHQARKGWMVARIKECIPFF